MPITIDNNIVGLLSTDALYLAKCWEIERTDGIKFRFTDSDTELEVLDFTYSPTDSIIPSSYTRSSGLGDDHGDLSGIVSDDSITHEDLRAGKFGGAKVTEYLVDWRVPWAGPLRTTIYWIVKTDFDGEDYQAQTEGLTRLLRQRIGDTCTRNCRYDLGRNKFGVISTTSGCKFDVVGATKFGLSVATIQEQRRIFRVTGTITDADGFYNLGRLEFTDGNNEDHVNQVREWTLATKQIELQVRTPFDITVGDLVNMEPGCDKLLPTCTSKFANAINYGGLPFMPGLDKALQAPRI